MPIYDPIAQRMAIRIVYDGIAWAGKTTNVRQLCTLFAAQRSSEVYSPADRDGRTLYFDWMQIMAGVVSGFPLLCQVVSVPGQVVLTPRRRHLLSTADVVVYVCDSSPRSLALSRAGLSPYEETGRQRGGKVPLVLQANKQDQADALDGTSLGHALGLDGAPVVEAIARDGVGVVDTFVTAVRTVVRAFQDELERGTLCVQVRHAETASEVLGRLLEEKIDPEWAAEMLLEEAEAALLVQEATLAAANDEPARLAGAGAAEDLAQPDREPTTEREPGAKGAQPTPPLPSADVPTGFIWPAHTGRAVVRALALGDSKTGAIDAEGVVSCIAHRHIVRTSTRARFADGEAARQALVRGAREYTQLGGLLVPETVLVAQPAPDGTCWLWTVRPELPTIAHQLANGSVSPDVLAAYGAAAVHALRVGLRRGFSVNLAPQSFGLQRGDTLRYVGELSSLPVSADGISTSVSAAVAAIDRAGAEPAVFLAAFERALQGRGGEHGRLPFASDDIVSPTASARLYALLASGVEGP